MQCPTSSRYAWQSITWFRPQIIETPALAWPAAATFVPETVLPVALTPLRRFGVFLLLAAWHTTHLTGDAGVPAPFPLTGSQGRACRALVNRVETRRSVPPLTGSGMPSQQGQGSRRLGRCRAERAIVTAHPPRSGSQWQ